MRTHAGRSRIEVVVGLLVVVLVAGLAAVGDLAFADTVNFGVLVKDYQPAEQPGRYGPPELVNTARRPVTTGLDPKTICTSHVERSNLTIRTFMKRFTRLALGFSKKLANLTRPSRSTLRTTTSAATTQRSAARPRWRQELRGIRGR